MQTMKMTKSVVAGVALVTTLACTAVCAEQMYEEPGVVNVDAILPPDVIKGPNHTVQYLVHNDGFLNIYTIDSKYGQLRAVSNATLYKRIQELNAMEAMQKLKGTKEFEKGVEEKADDFVDGGVSIIKDPVGSLHGAASGVASIFKSVDATMRYGKSSTESGRLSVLTGFDKTKREYAREFHIDPYSRNPYLQKELNEISKAGFLGKTIIRVGSVAVTGGAGIALSVTGNVEALNDMLTQKSAGDLRVYNESLLKKMGVDETVIELFLENRNFTLTQQTALVMALDSMPDTVGRATFVKFAALTDHEDMAAFRQRQADMYASYNRKIAPVKDFEFVAQIAVARNDKDSLVACAPVDMMLWTHDVADLAGSLAGAADQMTNVKGKEFWAAGALSDMARGTLEKWGWKVQPDALSVLAAN